MPFIARYRKEAYRPELSETELWLVLDSDARYAMLMREQQRARDLLASIDATGPAAEELLVRCCVCARFGG